MLIIEVMGGLVQSVTTKRRIPYILVDHDDKTTYVQMTDKQTKKHGQTKLKGYTLVDSLPKHPKHRRRSCRTID